MPRRSSETVPVRSPSWWWTSIGGPPAPRSPLDADRDADVCIVGGGYTGLWTAYALRRLDPGLDVVVLEAEHAGFGASGRNGGWVLGDLSTGERMRRTAGPERLAAQDRAIQGAVDDVAAACAEEGIECDLVKGGTLTVAQTAAEYERLLGGDRGGLMSDGHGELLDAAAARARVNVAGIRGARWFGACARVQPAKLVAGLAKAAERRGAVIHERTRATDVAPGRVRTPLGTVRARWVVRATEGYTARLPGLARAMLPLNSAMVVTEPLGDDVWSLIGWEGCETLLDGAHAYCYLQRTADGRIAIGGRGVPYRFGSRTDRAGELPDATAPGLRGRLERLFPVLRGVRLDGAWAGVLGVRRDWGASVHCDRASGMCWAGGYAGEGVAAANLAGRTLADLICGRDSELTRLPWVGHDAPEWEPEPLRYLAVHTVYATLRTADAIEARTGKQSRLAEAAAALSGR